MMPLSPVRLMVIGVILMVAAAVAEFFMALRWIHPWMWLNFVAVIASIVGSVLALYGLFQKTRPRDE